MGTKRDAMKRKQHIIVWSVMTILSICVQRLSAQTEKDITHKLITSYTDSLKWEQETPVHIQKKKKGKDYLKRVNNENMYRLFLPFTFYHSVVNQEMNMRKTQKGEDMQDHIINDILMSMYLKRPDLVINSDKTLKNFENLNNEISQPIQRDFDLVEQIAPSPIEQTIEPINVFVKQPNFWTIKGDYYLQFLQNFVTDNWHKGGESNYSMLGSITMEANYNNKQKVKWDNKLEMKLGFLTSQSDSLHSVKTSEDIIRYTGKLGLQATKKWYYTLQLLTYTQFYRGHKSNDPKVYSDFMSPFNLNISPGMDYTVEAFGKSLKGNIHLAPLAYNFRYVGRLDLAERYGLKKGQHTLNDFGSQFTIDLVWKISDNIEWKTRLYGFTPYSRVELEWENTFSFRFNRYISTNIFIYPRFDDGASKNGNHGYWQFKEFTSIGFSYSF